MNLKKLIYRDNSFFAILIDILIGIIFLFIILSKYTSAAVQIKLPSDFNATILFTFIWVTVSIIMGKYNFSSFKKAHYLNSTLHNINIIVFSILCIFLFALDIDSHLRLIVLGISFISYLIEMIIFNIFYSINKKLNNNKEDLYYKTKNVAEYPLGIRSQEIESTEASNMPAPGTAQYTRIPKAINTSVFNYFLEHVNINNPNVWIISTTNMVNVESLEGGYRTIINLNKVNDLRYINKFFEAVNHKLPDAGMFLGCVETSHQRYKRIRLKFPIFIKQLVIMMDFVINRILPRLSSFKRLYFSFTMGKGRSLSKAEVLGRLVSCGFEIIEYKEINNLTYFTVIKTKQPDYNLNPSYGLLYKMPRIGKAGKVIYVYKLRTMHPFSEYLQEYVYLMNNLDSKGKFTNDFRTTYFGEIIRKLWIDELPMLLNFLKGEIKLVGVRPLSRHYYNLYTKELQKERIKYKPGLIPPYYVDLPKSFDEIMASEMKYLGLYAKNPLKTDLNYLLIAILNIIKGARSK